MQEQPALKSMTPPPLGKIPKLYRLFYLRAPLTTTVLNQVVGSTWTVNQIIRAWQGLDGSHKEAIETTIIYQWKVFFSTLGYLSLARTRKEKEKK